MTAVCICCMRVCPESNGEKIKLIFCGELFLKINFNSLPVKHSVQIVMFKKYTGGARWRMMAVCICCMGLCPTCNGKRIKFKFCSELFLKINFQ